eukprot:scaffold698_cov61-Phaeocystis_antarctica.AAC.1
MPDVPRPAASTGGAVAALARRGGAALTTAVGAAPAQRGARRGRGHGGGGLWGEHGAARARDELQQRRGRVLRACGSLTPRRDGLGSLGGLGGFGRFSGPGGLGGLGGGGHARVRPEACVCECSLRGAAVVADELGPAARGHLRAEGLGLGVRRAVHPLEARRVARGGKLETLLVRHPPRHALRHRGRVGVALMHDRLRLATREGRACGHLGRLEEARRRPLRPRPFGGSREWLLAQLEAAKVHLSRILFDVRLRRPPAASVVHCHRFGAALVILLLRIRVQICWKVLGDPADAGGVTRSGILGGPLRRPHDFG